MRVICREQEQAIGFQMIDQSMNSFTLVGRVDWLRGESDMIADDLRRCPRNPRNFGPNALPGLVRSPDQTAAPRQSGLCRDDLEPWKFCERTFGDHAYELIFEGCRLRDVVLDIVGWPSDRRRSVAIGAACVNPDR